jgi:hypothetical protein
MLGQPAGMKVGLKNSEPQESRRVIGLHGKPRRPFTRLGNRPPLQQIVSGELEHFKAGFAAQSWLNLTLRLLGFAEAGLRESAVNPMDGILGAAQRSRNRKNNDAAKNKYGAECNNVCMFECPNQKGIHADK